MIQEDKNLLLKDLCARLPYGVIAKVEEWNGYMDRKLEGFSYGYFHTSETDYDVDEVMPYLRPMSSMTKNEKKEFDKLMNLVEERCINAYGKGGYTLAFTDLNDWLNAHHFDYRGLIEKGLALEAPEGMYNEKEK